MEPEERTELDDLLEEALEEEAGPLLLEDFDSGAKRFLTEPLCVIGDIHV